MTDPQPDFGELLATPPKGTRFILVRHGETDWNRERRFQGHTDIPLNQQGVQQAGLVQQYLQALELTMGNPPYQVCVSSDLGRAKQTAAIIHGDRQPPVSPSSALRERDYGHLSGLTAEEMQQKSPVEYAGMKARQVDATIRSGESIRMFYNRVVSEFQRLAVENPGQCVLLVAHGGVLDCIYRHCSGTLLEKPRDWLLPNCALNLVELDSNEKASVIAWAWQGHLAQTSADRNLDEVDGRIT
ncbi:MAG TPA: histidine phosphatase family protein [Limnobacter sp.]|nr:histidine phosphatase family protein [Limnobacter sp.]